MEAHVSVSPFIQERPFEKIMGQLLRMAPVWSEHGDIQAHCVEVLRPHISCKVFVETYVYLGEDIVGPDISVVCDKSKIKPDGIHGPPDLVAEILSASTWQRDVGYKKDLYERFGVKEYWIVNRLAKIFEIYALVDEKYELHSQATIIPPREVEMQRIDYNPVVTSKLFPHISMDIREIFWP